MNIVLCGGTGLIGSKIIENLASKDDHIYILTRNARNKTNTANITYIEWLHPDAEPERHLKNIDILINLAGETINSRWTPQQKKEILESRLEATRNCLSLMKKLTHKPSVFLNASAVGFYGTSLSSVYTEDETKAGTDFLASVVKAWEQEANKAASLGVRTVLLRFGVVLSSAGGALSKIALPYQLFAGGKIGSGQQWLSWVHIDDAVNLIKFAIKNEKISGPLNITAPHPKRMDEFGKILGRVLNKPHWLPTPSFALKLILGEMSMLVLEGQRAIPKKAIDNGFQFTYPNLADALKNIYS